MYANLSSDLIYEETFFKMIRNLQKLFNNFPLTYTGILSTCALPADLESTPDPPPGGDQ